MAIALCELKKGAKATLKCVNNPSLELKMLEFGFVEGTTLTVSGCAPFGDPAIIECTCTKLILRRSETSQIMVEPQL
ncbi:MAG: ferrous iron transport protein A [Bacteroidetes bacterium]|nr:ferrous iron transport protein A [Bacteroidota bacterium]